MAVVKARAGAGPSSSEGGAGAQATRFNVVTKTASRITELPGD
jgi:hypothetical protein